VKHGDEVRECSGGCWKRDWLDVSGLEVSVSKNVEGGDLSGGVILDGSSAGNADHESGLALWSDNGTGDGFTADGDGDSLMFLEHDKLRL
jgi:hypothetical protein